MASDTPTEDAENYVLEEFRSQKKYGLTEKNRTLERSHNQKKRMQIQFKQNKAITKARIC